jgi:thioredoxin 1
MANDTIIALKKENFDEVVLKSDKLIIVDFWAPWCGPCRTVGPIMDELAGEYDGKAKIGKINVDEEGELAAKFRIMSIPTVLFFKSGEIVDRVIGARSKDEFSMMITKNL